MKDEEGLPQRPRCVELLYLSLFNYNVYVEGSRENRGDDRWEKGREGDRGRQTDTVPRTSD